MASIRINTDGLQNDISSMRSYISELDSLSARTQALLSQIGDSWEGDASTAYLTAMQQRLDKAQQMKKVLEEDTMYPYLMQNAAVRIGLARDMARHAGMLDEPLISLGGDMWALFPWLGTYAFMALERFLKIRCAALLGLKGLESAKPYYMQFTMKAGRAAFYEIVVSEAGRPLDAMELVYKNEVPVFEKYDEFVPDELVRKGFAYGVLDIDGMLCRVRSWETYTSPRVGGERRKNLP